MIKLAQTGQSLYYIAHRQADRETNNAHTGKTPQQNTNMAFEISVAQLPALHQIQSGLNERNPHERTVLDMPTNRD